MLLKNEKQILRVLMQRDEKSLVIDCIKRTMPKWVLADMFSADGKPFDYILDIFTHRPDVDETAFFFSDEEPKFQHYWGYLPQYTEAPYWA